MTVCFQEDDFTYEKPRWVAVLTDGTEVLQDDDRPDLEPNSWKRLKEYTDSKKLRISRVYLKFRSNVVQIPNEIYFNPDTDTLGYVIYRGIVSHLNQDFSFHTIVLGRMYWATEKLWLHKTTFKTPELTPWEESAQEMTETDFSYLILKEGNYVS